MQCCGSLGDCVAQPMGDKSAGESQQQRGYLAFLSRSLGHSFTHSAFTLLYEVFGKASIRAGITKRPTIS